MSSISNVAKNDTPKAVSTLLMMTIAAYTAALTVYLWADIEAVISWTIR